MTPLWDLRLGDCLDPQAGMASLADKSVDHVITDPPYEAEAHTLGRRHGKPGGGAEEAPLDFAPIGQEQRAQAAWFIASATMRWCLVFCQAEALTLWRDALAAGGGLQYKRACVWIKPGAAPQFTGDRPGMGYETIVACHAHGKSRWNGGGLHGVFEFPPETGERVHMTQKPVALMEKLIRLFTDPGDLILDPFAGSGTTGVAAIRLGRRFIGWEKDPKYHAIAVKRLTAAREQLELCA